MISAISFCGNDSDNKVTASEVGVGVGATVGGAKYGTGAFKRFKLTKGTKDLVTLSSETTEAIKTAANAGSKIKRMWAQVGVNTAKYKKTIVEWAKSTKMAKFLKPVFESKAFAKVSGLVGGVGALFVFISGLGEIGNTVNKVTNRRQAA